jgi:amidase
MKPLEHSLDFISALEAAEVVRKKQISSVELTQRAFERLDRYNGQLNAFVKEMREVALAQAKADDEAQARGQFVGDFHGAPFSVKESFGVQGYPAAWGISAFRDVKSPANSEAVTHLVNGGAVLLGATNVATGLSDWLLQLYLRRHE